MIGKRYGAGILMATLVLSAGCRRSQEPAGVAATEGDAVVARYSDGEIRRSEIREAVSRRLAAVPQPVAVETRREIVRRVVERRVRVAEMRKAMQSVGYGQGDEARFVLQAAEEKVLAAAQVAAELGKITAADALVAEAVERRLQFVRPEEARKFSHIFLRAPAGDAAARAKAQATMAEIQAALGGGAGFNGLAERYSDSVMARGGGRIEWTARKDLQPALAEIIFGLREGAVSRVVETKDGLHLFRLDGIRSGSPVDVEGVRRAVRRELDAEAATVAERGLRQRTLDAAGAEFASTARLANLIESGDGWAARWSGGEVRAAELRALSSPADAGGPPAEAVLREIVENRLLAARRRASPVSADLEEQIAEARDAALLDAYRAHLVAGIDTEPTEAEIAQFYRENAQSALFLRDYHVDLLFFPQSGDGVEAVYAAAEGVVAKLRDGASFDSLLVRPATSDARICRDAHPVDFDSLGRSFLRLRRALLNLEVEGVSPALYFDGPRSVVAAGQCVLEGRGVAFVRLREMGTLPLESARESVRAQVAERKRRAGIDAIQGRLIRDAKLEILLPEG